MSMMFLDWVVIIITIFICIKNYKNIVQDTRLVVFYLVVLFFVVPLIMDAIFMAPEYIRDRYIGFQISQNDVLTRCIYDLMLLFTEFVILKYKKNAYTEFTNQSMDVQARLNKVLIFFSWFPIFLALVLPVDKGMLFTFQWRELELFEYNSYVSLIEKLSYIGVCSAIVVFNNRCIRLRVRLLYIFAMYGNMCLQGKRSILFFLLLTSIITLIPGLRDAEVSIEERKRKLLLLVLFAGVVLAVMIGLSLYVKITYRGYSVNNDTELYTQMRIDMLRDDRVRMAIYSLVHPDKMQILDYPGQTLLMFPIAMFPLDYIFGYMGINPLSYAVFFSAALEGLSVANSYTFMTPNIWAELISNLGYLGLLCFPFVCVWFAKKAAKYPYPVNVFIFMSFISLQLYPVPYMMYFIEFTLLLCFVNRFRITFGGR